MVTVELAEAVGEALLLAVTVTGEAGTLVGEV
jgi:hypothetical protein